MKFVVAALVVASASAFTVLPGSPVNTRRSTHLSVEGGGKINGKIDLESPKVVNNVAIDAGEKKVFCRCWKSGTFPLCDAAHVAHNKETGDNVGPLIVSCAKTE